MDKIIYNYDPDTGALLSAMPADLSPLEEGAFLVPAHATDVAPPEAGPNTCPVFDVESQSWNLVADYRGSYFDTTSREPVAITALGVMPADLGLTDQVPPDGSSRFFGGAWQRDLAAEREAVWTAIKARRDALMRGGFRVGEHWFHSDADSRIQHLGLKDKARDLLAAGGAMADPIVILGQPVAWKTLGGAFVPVTAQLAHDIVTAAGDLDATVFVVAETHRQALAVADPALYDFSGGWPSGHDATP